MARYLPETRFERHKSPYNPTSWPPVPLEIPSQSESPVSSPTNQRSRKHLLTLFNLAANKLTSHQSDILKKSSAETLSHEQYLVPVPASSNTSYVPPVSLSKSTAGRQPRHIPIIIPDFAEPFSRDKYSDRERSNRPQILQIIESADGCSRQQSLSSVGEQTNYTRSVPVTTPDQLGFWENEECPEMNNSQVSLVTSEHSTDDGPGMNGSVNGSNTNASPLVGQQSPAQTNLSGLVCNVHRTTGHEPPALVGATTTILGDKLYVFGGRIHSRSRPHLTNDIYELDLIRRHWTKVEMLGNVPLPRYFHSVCALGDSKLVCYGGMSPSQQQNGHPQKISNPPQPEIVVMSDIHVFDAPSRTWTLITNVETPQGRYAHCAAILPSSAIFTSAEAPLSALHHNTSSTGPHSGTLGVQIDGSGGAEMVVVGGQDSSNNYIEQISVFNLRSLRWTGTKGWDRKCGAYKSMVSPMTGIAAELVGQEVPLDDRQAQNSDSKNGTALLIYSNYNFLDVKLELQIRLPDGNMIERSMRGPVTPPGLRFPNGGIIDSHFVVSGTYLTASKHEYALWALDLRTLTWNRIDTNGAIFSHGSWNRGVLWNRRNTFVILGHRKRNLLDDYNHRRINFTHVCLVELEAFGLYDNPRKTSPTSAYASVSSPPVPLSLQSSLPSSTAGGRLLTSTAEQLGQAALSIPELCDMELVALGGERIPCNSHVLARRWGLYFIQLLEESTTAHENKNSPDGAHLRPRSRIQASRNSAITITPSVANGITPSGAVGLDTILSHRRSISRSTAQTLVELPNASTIPSSRPRALYLPHMAQTIQLMLFFLYTSSLPSVGTQSCTPHSLCSLLQLARPYQIDGLLEATVERLHEVLDGRNAAAVFNAAAMAAGGGRGLCGPSLDTMDLLDRRESEGTTVGDARDFQNMTSQTANMGLSGDQLDSRNRQIRNHKKHDSLDSQSTATTASASTDFSHTDGDIGAQEGATGSPGGRTFEHQIWTGDLSSVFGLQKRGLRGLMEGRRMRERANTLGSGE